MKYKLQDLIDLDHFQTLQDRLNEIYCFPSAIIDNDGNILTATAWQDICTRFYRKNQDSERECRLSDQYICSHLHEANPGVTYCCPHGLVDNAIPIIIGGVHYGNFFTGQFFLQKPDLQFYKTQAQKYGFDEEAFLKAVEKVPIWTKAQLDSYLFFIQGLLVILSESGLKKIKEAESSRQIEASQVIIAKAFKASAEAMTIATIDEGKYLAANDAFLKKTGWQMDEVIGHTSTELNFWVAANQRQEFIRQLSENGFIKDFEIQYRMRSGELRDFLVASEIVDISGSKCSLNFISDITERKQTEQKLNESHQRLEFALRGGALCMWDWHPQTGKVIYSDIWAQILEYQSEEVEPTVDFFKRHVHPDDLPTVLAHLTAHMEGRLPAYESIHRLQTKSGRWLWVLDRGQITERAPDGQPLRVTGVFTDISKRMQMEEALRGNELRYQAILTSATDAIVTANSKGNIVSWNPSASSVFGYTEEEVLGQPLTLLMSPQYQEGHLQGMRRMKSGGEYHVIGKTVELEGRRKCGDPFPLELSLAAWETAEGRFFTGIIRDITERRRIEQNYKSLFREMLDGFALHEIIVDEQGLPINYRFLAINPAFERMTGLKADSILGRTVLEALPGTERHWIENYGKVALTGEPAYFENYSSDLKKHFEVTAFRPAPGQFACIFVDITERKSLEAQLRQAQKLESIGQLAGGVAHDYNNILAATMMQLSFLQMNVKLDEETRESIKLLMADSQRAANLTRQLLMFSRRSVLEVKSLDLNKLVADLFKMLNRLIGEDISVRREQEEALVFVEADPSMLEQVLMNLALNARDAMPKGGTLTIRTHSFHLDSKQVKGNETIHPGLFACLSVADTGCGMDEATVQRIFEPFFTTKEPGKGTGLGLATVYGIVGQHKGWIEVDSQLGSGTTFRVYLPAKGATTAPSPPTESDNIATVRGHETILFVEDEAILRRTVARGLRLLGYGVLEAENGPEALRVWQEHEDRVDLLFSDMIMPEGMTGLELAEKLRAKKSSLKVILTSGYNPDAFGNDKLFKSGILCLRKPYYIDTLSKIVRQCLDGGRAVDSEP